MSTYVRIQDSKWGTDGLFDADRLSWDMGMCEDNARHGVSCCDDLEALLDYYVQCPIEIGDDPVIITMEGRETNDQPLDAQYGERLITPTRIVSIESAEAAGFFAGINARLDD